MLRQVARGRPRGRPRERLVITHRTVENHVQYTLQKLQLHNRVELARYAIEQGICDAERARHSSAAYSSVGRYGSAGWAPGRETASDARGAGVAQGVLVGAAGRAGRR